MQSGKADELPGQDYKGCPQHLAHQQMRFVSTDKRRRVNVHQRKETKTNKKHLELTGVDDGAHKMHRFHPNEDG